MSSTLSKIYKRRDGEADIRSFTLPSAMDAGKVGVHPFEYLQTMDSSSPTGSESPVDGSVSSADSLGPGQTVDLDEVRKQAFQDGFAEGEAAGREQAASEFREAVESFGQAVQSLAEYKPTLRYATQREVVALALAVAQRVLRREVTLDPATVLGIVRTCLEEFNAVEVSRLEVSPRDYDVVTDYFQRHPVQNLEIVADPAVTPGGVMFETSQGTVDARIETQLEEIENGLADG